MRIRRRPTRPRNALAQLAAEAGVRPSLRGIGAASDLHHHSLMHWCRGSVRPRARSIGRLAATLGVSEGTIRALFSGLGGQSCG